MTALVLRTYLHTALGYLASRPMVMASVLALLAFAATAQADPFTNSIGIKMVEIPAGSFLMGSSAGGDFDERPVHAVTLSSSFFMSATEISNAQFEQFNPAHREFRGRSGLSKADDEAVIFVSWNEATRFCEWLSAKEGKVYRLATEAEWEYACRGGLSTPFHTGTNLPPEFHKNQKDLWQAEAVPLTVGGTRPNPWGLHDMHGNVEEWCYDWYGPYMDGPQTDPVGYAGGDFKVTRGGSHGTPVAFLRSANRSGTLPEDKHWLIGLRIVQADFPSSKPLPNPAPPLWASNVSQNRHQWQTQADPAQPFFRGPRVYVKIPPHSNGPLFSHHNHQPALTACPNGDLLAVWYSCRNEPGRELAVVASRLRRGSDEWEPAAPFWDTPDRNDHGNALLWDGGNAIYHFNGLSTDATWGKLALIMRFSLDNGVTWSKARLIEPEHGLRNQVIAGAFQTRAGEIVVPCDAVTGGKGGSAVHISPDAGQTWTDPGRGAPEPKFVENGAGAWIAGIHAGVVELKDGRWLALGRGDSIRGQMPRSISSDSGQTWRYSASGLPPIGSGQRVVLRRLREGPLFLASFAKEQFLTNAAGQTTKVTGLFGALSFDDGQTWPVRRLITDGGPARELDGGGNTGKFTLSATSAEPRGYLAGTQTPEGLIHLISSKQHYAFNLAWLTEAAPASALAPAAGAAPGAGEAPGATPDAAPGRVALENKFKQTMANAQFAGRWCLIENGRLGEEHEDKYTIQSVAKVGADLWLVYARIQYGTRDVLVPVPVQVKWAGDTPVISLTQLPIPGLGTYSARVVIYEGSYAGTWSAPDHAGLLYGVIQK